jgi:hypothetical protein
MLVRDVTRDKEGVTDRDVHHLRYAYLPHTGSAVDTQPWKYAYEFNQPLIVTWKTGQTMNIQLPWDAGPESRKLGNLESGSPLPPTFSLLRAEKAIVADLYRQGGQIEAVILNYNPTAPGSIQVGGQDIALPQSVFTVMPVSPSTLGAPSQK